MHRATRTLLGAAHGASTIVIGLYHQGRRALVARGRTTHAGGPPADAGTRFEIGSLTKTFTALLLAEQAARGELHLHDPLARHLPHATALPAGGEDITLTHLATHTSGLPRLPPGLVRSALPRTFTNPYAAFTTENVLHALTRTRLRAAPGTRVRYSNFGLGLLGHALTAAADHTPYPALLNTRVLHPLRLHATDCAPAARPGTTQATGYHHHRTRPPFHIPGLPAAGILRSSARDLLTTLEALLDPTAAGAPPTLTTALREVLRPRLRTPRNTGLSLVWNIRSRTDGSTLYHHSGGTCGFTTFAGFNPHHRTALVALANTAPGRGNTLIQEAYNTLTGLHR
ncbi:serine hydrolase domain-containing protein [Streptomyces sp. ALI-76-A]|uniref:serine hydrolase domain-containing protein n=1 Tax=Streptomyces sp. ALI-76-A TaxID=3025736 RepID=UPI00256F4A3E|nr:serine hydrolase domain-containing protein [Streptomyces sp. ALI-76-A]MDL5206585.1 serine hydrolase domain-containing protein [Streptomyces sp. ALI-76-A]